MKQLILISALVAAQVAHAQQPIFIVKKVAKLKSCNLLLVKVENRPKNMFIPKFTNYRDTAKVYQVGDTIKFNN